jgi:hypothetical protein
MIGGKGQNEAKPGSTLFVHRRELFKKNAFQKNKWCAISAPNLTDDDRNATINKIFPNILYK